jgi:LacI family transcriptional regulator
MVAEVSRLRVPYVLIDREMEGTEAAGAVFSDHRAGMEPAVQHLIDLGHRSIGFIGGSPRVRPTRERSQAVLRVCDPASARATVVSGEFTPAFGRDASAAMLDQPDPPTALIAGGNQILAGLLRTVHDRGLRVPEDLSIVTCDRLALSEFLEPPIATIERDTRLLGRRAAEILLQTIATGEAERLVLPVAFTPTASCGVAPAG